MSAHAKIGPSSLNYRRQCRAFESTGGTSPAAEEGPLIHAAIEKDYYEALDTEQERLARTCLALLQHMEEDADEVHRELKVNIKLGKHVTFGTADRVIIKGKLGYLVDFKFGRLGVPDANENLQAMAYAVGVFDKFPELDAIQTWLFLPRRDETSHCTIQRATLPSIRKTLETLFDEITQPSPPRTPCAACQYCTHADSCPALTASALILGRKLEPLLIPDSANPETMTPEVLDEIALPLARVLASWGNKVKDRATKLAMEGHDFEHHKLVARARPVSLTDAPAVYDLVKDTVPVEEFLRATKVSLSQLKAVAKSLAERGKGKAAQDELVERLKPLLPESQDNETFYLRKK